MNGWKFLLKQKNLGFVSTCSCTYILCFCTIIITYPYYHRAFKCSCDTINDIETLWSRCLELFKNANKALVWQTNYDSQQLYFKIYLRWTGKQLQIFMSKPYPCLLFNYNCMANAGLQQEKLGIMRLLRISQTFLAWE